MTHEFQRVLETIPSNRQFFTLLGAISERLLVEYGKTGQPVLNKVEDGSPQTEADRISHKMLMDFLTRNTPFPVLSEESDRKVDGNLNLGTFWIVDPLDGTRDFLAKTGEFSIMMALIMGNKPIFGIVHQPLTGMCYIAKKNEGAFLCNGKDGSSIRLHVSDIADISKMRMLTSRFHREETDFEVARKLEVKELIPHGSFGLKVGLIVRGVAEIYLNSSGKTSIWDSAPNILILSEAGGKITDLDGNELLVDPKKEKNENGIVATNGQIHTQVVSRIKNFLPKTF